MVVGMVSVVGCLWWLLLLLLVLITVVIGCCYRRQFCLWLILVDVQHADPGAAKAQPRHAGLAREA